jgi:DNA-binding response OmpR family regulator
MPLGRVTPVTKILVASDGQWVRDQVRAAFVAPNQQVLEVTRGQDVRDTFARELPDLVILDLQIGNMGGVAAALDLRLEESGGRLPRATILLLLDRDADRFLAKRATADGELVKPVDAGTLRRAAKKLLEGAPPAPTTPDAEADEASEAS